METIKTPFSVALSYCLEQMGYGSQSKVARKLKISQPLINALKQGKSTGSEEKRRAIANYFGYDYDTFIKIGVNRLREDIEQQEHGANEEGFSLDYHQKTGKILQVVAEYMQALTVQASISYPENKIVDQSQKIYDAIIELRSLLDSIVYNEAEGLDHNEKCEIYFGKSEFSLEQAYENNQFSNAEDEDIIPFRKFKDPARNLKFNKSLLEIEKHPSLDRIAESVIQDLAKQAKEMDEKKTSNDVL